MFLYKNIGEIIINNQHANVINVKKSDLPLSCPMPDQVLWNQHPKVYLPIEGKKEVTCPYCGTKYSLKD